MAVEGCLHSLFLKHGPVRKQKPIQSGLIWRSKTYYMKKILTLQCGNGILLHVCCYAELIKCAHISICRITNTSQISITLINILYSSPNIVQVIKLRRMRWAGHVAHIGEKRGVCRVLVWKPEGKRPFGRPSIDGRILLRWIFRK